MTRIKDDRVCVAGLDEAGACIRPVLPGGVRLYHLYRDYQIVVRPRARVAFNLSECPVEPPHVEDWLINPSPLDLEGTCGDAEWEATLKKGAFDSVERIYDGHLQEGRWVLPGAATRSLGTLAGVRTERVMLGESGPDRTYRLHFTEGSGVAYNVAVTDLTFRKFSDLRTKLDGSCWKAAGKITQLLKNKKVYLRLGLTRPWAQPGAQPVCWMQVTGIYSFPDYLGGKSFTDF